MHFLVCIHVQAVSVKLLGFLVEILKIFSQKFSRLSREILKIMKRYFQSTMIGTTRIASRSFGIDFVDMKLT